jgi:hypothetical protein
MLDAVLKQKYERNSLEVSTFVAISVAGKTLF